jgi:hypothetical protein
VAEAKKRSTHGFGAVGHTFVPFAIESYGSLGLDAMINAVMYQQPTYAFIYIMGDLGINNPQQFLLF